MKTHISLRFAHCLSDLLSLGYVFKGIRRLQRGVPLASVALLGVFLVAVWPHHISSHFFNKYVGFAKVFRTDLQQCTDRNTFGMHLQSQLLFPKVLQSCAVFGCTDGVKQEAFDRTGSSNPKEPRHVLSHNSWSSRKRMLLGLLVRTVMIEAVTH